MDNGELKPKNKANQAAKAKPNKGSSLQDNRLKQGTVQRVAVIQLADNGEPDRSLANVRAYSSLIDHYGEDVVRATLVRTGLRVRGHHSGAAGDGMNAATRQDLTALRDALRAAPREAAVDGDGKEAAVAPIARGQRHTPEQAAAAAAKKAEDKAAKKAARKQYFYDGNKGGGGRGGGRGGGGRGGGAAGAAAAGGHRGR